MKTNMSACNDFLTTSERCSRGIVVRDLKIYSKVLMSLFLNLTISTALSHGA